MKGFGQLDMDEGRDIRTYLEDGDLFAVVNQTIQSPGGADQGEEASAPGAPKRERRPQPRADNEVTEMETVYLR